MYFHKITKLIIACFVLMAPKSEIFAQTDMDAVFMAPKNLCTGLIYSHSAWNHYWEGTFYRENLNLAYQIHRSLLGSLDFADRGVRHANFAELRREAEKYLRFKHRALGLGLTETFREICDLQKATQFQCQHR